MFLRIFCVGCLVAVTACQHTAAIRDTDSDSNGVGETDSRTEESGPGGISSDSGSTDAHGADTRGAFSTDSVPAGEMIVVTGVIRSDVTWTSNNTYMLEGGVFVGDDRSYPVLTIEPGTTIYASPGKQSFLNIRRGARIVAKGTEDRPIVFTSGNPPGTRRRADWGGISIQGNATVNGCLDRTHSAICEQAGGWGTGNFGGNNDADNSGILRYVRVELAGEDLTGDNPMDAVAFQGVGGGTVVNHLQIHMAAGDGVGIRGGTVDLTHIVISGAGDDSLDWTDGWRGRGQFIVIDQTHNTGDQGIEGDNNGDDNESTPVSQPTLSNLTVIGSPDANSSNIGILLREGTRAHIHNSIIADFNEACLDIDGESCWSHLGNEELTIQQTMVSCAVNFQSDSEPLEDNPTLEAVFEDTKYRNHIISDSATILNGYFSIGPAATGAAFPEDPFFTHVNYIGAIHSDDNWTENWTTSAPN